MSLDLQYYQDCFKEEGHHYKPNYIDWSHASDVEHVSAAFKELKGTKSADVLVKLVYDVAQLTEKNSRTLANEKSFLDAYLVQSKLIESLNVSEVDMLLPVVDFSELEILNTEVTYHKKSNQFSHNH